jgi:Protein of unknown function (DUF3775)
MGHSNPAAGLAKLPHPPVSAGRPAGSLEGNNPPRWPIVQCGSLTSLNNTKPHDRQHGVVASREPDMAKLPDLVISPEKVAAILVKARQVDVKDVVTDPDSGSNASDDAMISVLEDHPSDPAWTELDAMIRALNEDEQVDLVAMAWLGRGDGDIDDWQEIRSEAARAHNNRTSQYLRGIPLLSDYLEEALSLFGHSTEEFE